LLDGSSSRNWPLTRPGPIAGEASTSDDVLLPQIGAGNSAAWEVIVDRHLPAVARYAAYFLGDTAQGEDVAQETFVRLMKKKRPPGSRVRRPLKAGYSVSPGTSVSITNARNDLSR